jgi:hypothetical protein
VDGMLGDCPYNAWMIEVGWGCWRIRSSPFDTWRLGIVDALPVCDHIDFSMMSDLRVGLVNFTEIHWLDMILDSGVDSLRHYNLLM